MMSAFATLYHPAPVVSAAWHMIIHTCHQHSWGCMIKYGMGWLRLVGSLKLQVSFAKEPCKRDYILQKRPLILRSLVIVSTPYCNIDARLSNVSRSATSCTMMHLCISQWPFIHLRWSDTSCAILMLWLWRGVWIIFLIHKWILCKITHTWRIISFDRPLSFRPCTPSPFTVARIHTHAHTYQGSHTFATVSAWK